MVTIAQEPVDQPDALALLKKAWAYSDALYPAESNHHLDAAGLATPEVSFFVARRGGVALGCGALVRGPAGAEVKSLFVDEAARGLGIGRQLLAAIEGQAIRLGLTLIQLETGIRQPEAIRLYERAGYRPRGPFGAYRPDPLSLFMEKHLS